jgi:hypothetical protein
MPSTLRNASFESAIAANVVVDKSSFADLANEPMWIVWREEKRNGKDAQVPHSAKTRGKASGNGAHILFIIASADLAKVRRFIPDGANGREFTATAHVVTPPIGVASSLIGSARKLKVTSSYSVPATSWTALVGYSGSGKTPAIEVVRGPLNDLEFDREDMVKELRRKYELMVETAAAADKMEKRGQSSGRKW